MTLEPPPAVASGAREDGPSTPQPFSATGIALGAIALLLAILPTFVLPVLYPPEPIEQRAVGALKRLKDKVVSKAKGQEYEAPPDVRTEAKTWYRFFSLAAVVTGCAAILAGALGFARKEAWRRCAVAVGLGAAAIAMEYVLGIAGVIIILLAILSFFT